MNEKPRILVVDDQPSITDFLELYFCEIGFVSVAHSGVEALGLVSNSEFELIISDINMQPMTGIEFGFKARKLQPLTPIVFFSGEINGEETYRNDIELIGNSSFVNKNFEELKKLASHFFSKKV